ncbi:MAG TPA: hypothetical protein VFR37_02720 [Longimicrobium sp.]|nr:hypothetical protein [Longimicrobium sp.]
MKRSVTRGLFAAAFVAAMGFGAAQAVAAPSAAGSVRGCTPESCQKKCAMQGLTGFCAGRGCWCR